MRPTSLQKWVYVVVVAVLLAGGAVALTLLTGRPDPLEAADRLRAEARHEEALEAYQAVLATDPRNEAALWGVAASHLARQDHPVALAYLQRYLREHPGGPHAAEAQAALARVRGEYVASQQPSPELVPEPLPTIPADPSRQLMATWEQATRLERHSRLDDAIGVYAGLAAGSADGLVRGAALERIARCEAQRSPINYERIRHFYTQAQKAYREAGELANSDRCKELAYVAQEYARLSAERDRLVRERLELAKLAREAVPEPQPREFFEQALTAYEAGDDQTALRTARGLIGGVPAAWYILGMVHARQGEWDAARRELEQYLAKEPNSVFAEEAQRELAAMRGKRPLLLDDFRSPATKWRLADADSDTVPVTEVTAGPDPSDGPCMRIDPGQKAFASFEGRPPITIRLRLCVPPSDARPLAPTQFQPYGKDLVTCAPLVLDEQGFRFAGRGRKGVPATTAWQTLTIDLTETLVTAHVSGVLVGEVSREADIIGLSIECDEAERAGALYIDDVRIVEHVKPDDNDD